MLRQEPNHINKNKTFTTPTTIISNTFSSSSLKKPSGLSIITKRAQFSSNELNNVQIPLKSFENLDKQLNTVKACQIKTTKQTNILPFSRRISSYDLNHKPLHPPSIPTEKMELAKKLLLDINDNDSYMNGPLSSRGFSRVTTERMYSTRPQTQASTARSSINKPLFSRRTHKENMIKPSDVAVEQLGLHTKLYLRQCSMEDFNKPDLLHEIELKNLKRPVINELEADADTIEHDKPFRLVDPLLQYEIDLLGANRNKPITKHTPDEVAKDIIHIKKLKDSLHYGPRFKKKYLIDLINNRNLLKGYLKRKDQDQLVEEFTKLLVVAIKFDDVTLLLETYSILADIHFMAQDYKKAISFYNQLRIVSELSGDIPNKIKAYLGFSDCCKRLALFEYSHKFLRKALQYAWYIDNIDMQYEISDKIGMLYYHTGNLDIAKLYHKKYGQSELFNKDLEIVKFSNEEIGRYIKKYHMNEKTITPLFFEKLMLPKIEISPSLPSHHRYQDHQHPQQQQQHQQQHHQQHQQQQQHDDTTNFLTKKYSSLPSSPCLSLKKRENNPSCETPFIIDDEHIDNVFDNALNMAFFNEMSAQTQIEYIMKGEPEFEVNLGSPRLAMNPDLKEEFINQNEPKTRISTADRLVENKRMKNLLEKKKPDKSTYSLEKALSDHKLVLKDLQLRLQERFDSGKHKPPSFHELKKSTEHNGQSIPIPPMVFLNHQVIERANHANLKNANAKDKRIKVFFKNVLDHAIASEKRIFDPQVKAREIIMLM